MYQNPRHLQLIELHLNLLQTSEAGGKTNEIYWRWNETGETSSYKIPEDPCMEYLPTLTPKVI